MELLEEKKAILNGHFLLSSGLHSLKYIQMARVFQYPKEASFLGERLASLFFGENIDTVLSPALGGIIIGYEVARHLKKRAIFGERREGRMGLFREFELKERENVLIVEDVLTTGRTIKEMIELAEGYKANIVGIGVIVDRGKGFEKEVKSLIKMDIETYPSSLCPACQENLPLVKPGSR